MTMNMPISEHGVEGTLGNLRNRIPGQAAMSACLEIHRNDPERSWLRRVFGASPLSTEAWPWYQGALGEARVGRLLQNIGPEWTVLHAVPVGSGDSDIDHVVIGPAGVLTLNTKHHAGQAIWIAGKAVLVSGKKQRYVHAAAHEATRAAKLLSAASGQDVQVSGVLVFVGAKNLKVKDRFPAVAAVTDGQLLRHLKRLRPTLTPAQVAAVGAAAARPETWHKNPTPADSPAAVSGNFAALQWRVRGARRRRMAWAGVAFAGFLGAAASLPTALPLLADMLAAR